jgi:hypothetical protein
MAKKFYVQHFKYKISYNFNKFMADPGKVISPDFCAFLDDALIR